MTTSFAEQDQSIDYSHESALIQDAQRGDVEAFGRICTMHYPTVLQVLTRKTGDYATAEDLAQEATIRVMNALPGFEDRGKGMRGFFITTANRLFLDHARQAAYRKTSPADPHEMSQASLADPTEDVEAKIMEQQSWRNVTDLVHLAVPNADMADSFIARVQGEDDEATAQRQGVSLKTVRTRIFRAKEKLQAILEEHETPRRHNR